ncbi:hypothetical protein L249_4288 [Ophiocordyceps polyrhachis-furcata BCC 54312]|uniref:BZIP domain-containing protein n=1 Tax=Ophiocordyceps polyrhachis-furcata BCC 54312 TaxID=1330021 RepID=A0A367L7Z2_9HYPO|nr:hypothetical protein L249_4288 [Ophiocordyceps polyrhachis-furcata BCC 54312]
MTSSRKRLADQIVESSSPQGQRKKRMMTPQDMMAPQDMMDPSSFLAFPFVGEQMPAPDLAAFDEQFMGFGDLSATSHYPVPQPATPPGGSSLIVVAGHSMGELGIEIPSFLPSNEVEVLHDAIQQELQYQKENPPKLPPSKVADLPPKEVLPRYVTMPKGADAKMKDEIQTENNRISEEIQRLDRQRNNLAAKKSRALRLEARDMYRQLFIEATAKLFFYRLREAAAGRSPDAWERLSPGVREDLIRLVDQGAREVENDQAEAKKREDALKRRSRKRTMRRRVARSTQPVSPATTCEQLDVVTPHSDCDDNVLPSNQDFEAPRASSAAETIYDEVGWDLWQAGGA